MSFTPGAYFRHHLIYSLRRFQYWNFLVNWTLFISVAFTLQFTLRSLIW